MIVCPWHTVILYRPSDVPFLNASLSLWLEIPSKGKNMVQIWLWKMKFVFFQTHHLERTKGKIEQSTRFTDEVEVIFFTCYSYKMVKWESENK